jgi:hypothetical protein
MEYGCAKRYYPETMAGAGSAMRVVTTADDVARAAVDFRWTVCQSGRHLLSMSRVVDTESGWAH